ncbi:MAG TPA: hypothetical protein VFV68_06835 [Agriterribacter sp.]|nr:hypothetical protein [Agriterribacter sp.]
MPGIPAWISYEKELLQLTAYVFKLVNGGTASDIMFGMIKLNTVTPETSIDFE